MKRLVYLYELDSVRNSKKEIVLGQQALFEEIVKKGNTVVLSYNQLTDSEAFIKAVLFRCIEGFPIRRNHYSIQIHSKRY